MAEILYREAFGHCGQVCGSFEGMLSPDTGKGSGCTMVVHVRVPANLYPKPFVNSPSGKLRGCPLNDGAEQGGVVPFRPVLHEFRLGFLHELEGFKALVGSASGKLGYSFADLVDVDSCTSVAVLRRAFEYTEVSTGGGSTWP